MKKIVKAVLLLTAVLTMIWIGALVYAHASYGADSSDYEKELIEYGITKSYFVEKLETEPQEWNTTEELGITFGEKMEDAETETYLILIVDEEKALPWMRDGEFTPYAVKYEDKFYRILFLWVTPGLPEHIKQLQIPIGGALGVCWVFTGALFVKWRKKE